MMAHASSMLWLLAQLTACNAVIPGIVEGWNVSVGSADDRAAAAKFFHVNMTEDDSAWTNNVMKPFIGKTMRMTGIDIEERNAFNTLIETAVLTGTVLWTITPGPQSGLGGAWVEHINGAYTGVAHVAGYVSRTSWIENDNKSLFGHTIANDWGVVDAISVTTTTVVLRYWSYKKAKFTMTWQLQSARDAIV